MTFQQRLKELTDRAAGPMGRRQRNRQFRELSERAQKLHAELVANEKVVADCQQRRAEQIAGAHAQIEEFVESIARMLDIDKDRVEAFKDPSLYDQLVFWKWHGVETVEQARDELTNEVARRSVGKTDLALLLSSIDHTAFNLFEGMPDSFKAFHGEELVREIVSTLTEDNFAHDLMQDTNWISMRTRWVRLGWRNISGEDEFSNAFIHATAERIAELHDRKTDLGAAYVPDTVLDSVLNRVSPESRDHMVRAFSKRLDHEYELLPKRTVNGVGSVVDEALDTTVGALRTLENDRAREAVLRLAERELDGVEPSSPFLRLRNVGDRAIVAFCAAPYTAKVRFNRQTNTVTEWNGSTVDGRSVVTIYAINTYVVSINGATIGAMMPFMMNFHLTTDIISYKENGSLHTNLFEISRHAHSKQFRIAQMGTVTPEQRLACGSPDPSNDDSGWLEGSAKLIDLDKSVFENIKSIGADIVPEAEQPTAPPLALGPTLKYSDHELMRNGRIAWEETYAAGMTDKQVWEFIAGVSGDAAGDAMSLFQPKWAVHAFQRLMTSHTFAAALMCSDVQREVLEGIEKQWDAFMVLVPNGMLIADGLEISRVLVATYSFGAQMILLSLLPNGQVRLALAEKPTLPELLAGDESELDVDSPYVRCMLMAKRLVAGLLLNLQTPTNFKARKVEAKVKGKGREAEPEHRIVTIGTPLTIDCRASVKEYIERGTRASGRKHGPPTVQVMVRGHYRMQPCGPRSMERKKIWIQPFWRGPEAALIQTRAKVPT